MKGLMSALLGLALLAGAALAQDPVPASNLEDGLKAAKKSGKPLLVVTIWKEGVCNSCDTWRGRVPKDADVAKQLPRFERVEWLYDGLNGKVIPWTKEHGGTSEDPAVQVFVVTDGGSAVTRAPRESAYAPGSFAKWLKDEADAFEKAHPSTRIPFVAAEVAKRTEGTTTTWSCAAIDDAKSAKVPVLLYVSRGDLDTADRAAKAQAAASRKLEKGLLDSETAAKALEGWRLVKLDLADADHLGYAKSLGVEKAPALLLFVPGEPAPQVLDPSIAADSFAFRAKKLAPRK